MSIYQKSVGSGQAIGVPGAFASTNPVVSPAIGRVAEEEVQVGGFVWDGTDTGYVKSSSAEAVKPVGFVAREITNAICAFDEMASDKVTQGYNVSVQVKGDFYAVSQTDARAGQKVFAVLADGAIQTAAAGATVAGAVETDWTVALGGTAGSVIIISNY